MKNYLELVEFVLNQGVDRKDRTGTGSRSIFGHQMRFDLQAGFPLLTTKACKLVNIAEELFWFLRGETNVRSLQAKGVKIWNEWADAEGELGPVYGKQWRRWGSAKGEIDQIAQLIENLRSDPTSRRHLVSAWNCGELSEMALPPCHALFQFYIAENKLSCQLYQRSCDIFLGLPYNIASYALLTHMLAQQLDLEVGSFVWSGGDVHLYHNHFEQAKLQLQRSPKTLPTLKLRKASSIEKYEAQDLILENYHPDPHIAAPIAV